MIEKVVERIVAAPRSDGGAEVRARRAVPESEAATCPRCAFPLVERPVGTHTVRGCDTCGGVFLEPQTVAVLERARDEAIMYSIARFLRVFVAYPMDRRPMLRCPFCQTPLVRRDLGETGCSIDSCATHGTFFDRGVVTTFVDLCEQRRAGDISEEDLANAGVKRGFGWWKK
ncbi:MAG: zf-TFIIB domain-containing protein [Polyangiaceae bacterium]